MAIIILLMIIILCTTSNFANKTLDVCHGGSKLANPGHTVFEKNGQFFKIIGPVYGTLEIQGILKASMRLSEKVNASVMLQSTRELYTIFATGKVYYNGQLLYEFDEDKDFCMESNSVCPIRRCAINKQVFQFDLRDGGYLPGLYSGKISLFSYDENYLKFHVLGLEFRVIAVN